MLYANNRMSCVRTKEAVNWAPSKVYNVNEAFNSRNAMVFNFKCVVVNIQKDHVLRYLSTCAPICFTKITKPAQTSVTILVSYWSPLLFLLLSINTNIRR
jgi:hypothetical protein